MKTIYKYDDNKNLMLEETENVGDDYELKANETFIAPQWGLYSPIRFIDNQWIGTSIAEYKKQNPDIKLPPDVNQLIVNQVVEALAAQQVKINAIQKQLEKEN